MTAVAQTTQAPASVAGVFEEYRAYGAAARLFRAVYGATGDATLEIVLSGPAGTGKSRACLELLNYLASAYPGARLLMLRKTRRSLTESGMVTFADNVLHPAQGVAWRSTQQRYEYPNGSIVAVGGMDKPGKIMSSEWDAIYVQEATELDENEWEAATTRLRNGKTPTQLLLGDCNPDAPYHWLRQRAERGQTLLLESRHEDNPTVTAAYLATLDRLTGVRHARLRLGVWAAAEGMVYEDSWDARRNIVARFTPPPEWPRYLAIDFGYNNPFVCLWAAQDPDGRLAIYRQLYMTQRIVADHCKQIRNVSRWGQPDGEPLPRAIICDHDAEDRATCERELGVRTLAAHKSVSDGLQAVAARLRASGDGKSRLMVMRDSVIERDRRLVEAKRPACLEEEVESYVWDDPTRREAPVKANDHALDAARYLVAYFDLRQRGAIIGPRLY